MALPTQKIIKAATTPITRGWDFTAECAAIYQSGEVYELGEVLRPSNYNGFEYLCTNAGQTSNVKKPNWKSAAIEGFVLEDGSAVFTAQQISNQSLEKTILTSLWAEATSTITFTSAGTVTIDGEQKTFVTMAGGVSGATYTVKNTVMFSDGTGTVATFELSLE